MSADAAPVEYEDLVRARHRVREALAVTPLVRAWSLGERLGRSLWIKPESLQRTGSFKPRGALNWVKTADEETLARGLVSVSAGNHAQALAWAASTAGARVVVVMPADASPIKVEATRAFGAEVVLHGEINEAIAKMEELRRERGLVLVHPFDDPRIIAGQGTVGLELLEQSESIDVLVCPIGGGGLISGIGLALKTMRPDVRIIGVEPEGAPTMRTAWDQGGPTRLEHVESAAPSLGAALAGTLTYEMSRRYVDDIVTLSDDEILDGLRRVIADGKLYAEPGGAIALSALLCGKVEVAPAERVVAVLSGGNFDMPRLKQLL